jgi:hypothetical protein
MSISSIAIEDIQPEVTSGVSVHDMQPKTVRDFFDGSSVIND